MSDERDDATEWTATEELTAYLDGELEESAQRQVEARLQSDPDYLARMQALQKTWDLLDRLPETEPRSSFTKTTMELVLSEARKEQRPRFSWVWPLRLTVMLAVFAGLFAISFGMLRHQQNLPNRILLEHLPTIANQQAYETINLDLSFLEALVAKNVFPRIDLESLELEADASPVATESRPDLAFPPKTTAERSDWLERLDVEQKSRLKQRLDDFLGMSPARQQELVDFGNRLHQHPQHEDLEFALQEYVKWLRTVDASERADLLDQPVPERLAAISRKRASQARERFAVNAGELPTQEDVDTIFLWFLGLINAHDQKIREHFPQAVASYRQENRWFRLPPGPVIQQLAERGPLNQLVDLLMEVDAPYVESLVMDRDSLELLYTLLSPDANAILLQLSEDEQREQLLQWVRSANRAFYSVSQERLKAFASTLSEAQRAELNRLSSKEYLIRLRELYRLRNSPVGQDLDDGLRELLRDSGVLEGRSNSVPFRRSNSNRDNRP